MSAAGHPFGAAYTDTRIQLHWLAQIPGAFGAAYAKADPMWRHVALHWSDEQDALLSAGESVKVGLRPKDATLLLVGDGVVEWPAEGRTLQEAVDWLTGELANRGLVGELKVRSKQQMPAHAVADGAPFSIDRAAAGMLHGMFQHGTAALEAWREQFEDAGPVLVWPHHFDLNTMRVLKMGERADAEDATTISFGMSPGDEGPESGEPYGYVTLWPHPSADQVPPLPKLPVGRWQTEGWVGTVLPASQNDGRPTLWKWLEASNEAAEEVLKQTQEFAS